MSLIPIPNPPVPIVWQNTVVDIEPSSRYGDAERTPDTASINTTFALVNEHPGEELVFVAPGHHETQVSARELGTDQGTEVDRIPRGESEFDELMNWLQGLPPEGSLEEPAIQQMLEKVRQFHKFRLTLGEGRRLVRFFTRLPIIREDDGSYKFSEIVPARFTQLVAHGDFSVVTLLPRSAAYDQPPRYNVRLVDWFKDVENQVFGDPSNPTLHALARRMCVTWWWQHDPLVFATYRYE
ncbi:MAG: hypothetical protein WD276_07375 [Actinomycetota bacterium]